MRAYVQVYVYYCKDRGSAESGSSKRWRTQNRPLFALESDLSLLFYLRRLHPL